MKKAKDIVSKTGKWLLIFGILFSQLSLPISVLADELTNEEEIREEVTEEENELQPEEGTVFQTGNISEETTVPFEELSGNPATADTLVIEWKEEKCIIKNSADSPVTLEQISERVEDLKKVLDSSDEEIELTDLEAEIYSNFKLVRTNLEGIESTYTIVILGDYDNNGIVDEEDRNGMLEELLTNEELQVEFDVVDVNEDEKFDILDITHPIFTDGTWENDYVPTDELQNYIFADNSETYVGEEIKVNYYIEGFNQDSLSGIEATINYDKELLELKKIEVDKKIEVNKQIKVNSEEQDISKLEDNHFVYLLDNFQSNDSLITLTFSVKKAGDASIAIEDIIASVSGKEAKIDEPNVSTSITILEYGKGGDEGNNESGKQEETLPNEPVKTESKPTTSPVVVQTKAVTKYVSLSTDNYIKSLTIKGYDIDFDMNKLEYSITVKNSVTSLDLDVVLNDEKASYYIEGNKEFKVGENTVNIVVKSESGSTRTYTIKVNREKEKKEATDKENEEEANNSSKTVIIILIIIVIIGLIYVIFKDDEEDQKLTKKESKK